MSDNTANPSGSLISPTAIPATDRGSGTPASIIASDEPHTDAIDDEPFDSVISETTRSTYGNCSMGGLTACTPRLARRPWPISRRFGAPKRPASPTENGGKL